LVNAHSSPAAQTAAGPRNFRVAGPAFAATQGAWRFFSNRRVTLPQLGGPLIETVRIAVPAACTEYLLVALDWSRLDYAAHPSKSDRIVLQNRHDLGYKLLTALALSDRAGEPLAPICIELKAADGVHSTRSETVLPAVSSLDGLGPVMAHVKALQLSRSIAFMIDREADSIAHYREWDEQHFTFLVRARENPSVRHNGVVQSLKQVADGVMLQRVRTIRYDEADAQQYVGETTVILERPASRHRTHCGIRKKETVAGQPLTLRLIVSEVRNDAGEMVARWLLLTNLDATIDASKAALWYYWRWRIESYHKLLKSAGQQVEKWLQDDAAALMRRLLVSAMACVLVWQLAREESAEAAEMRTLLVRLSGRVMKRGKRQRGFTEPALLAGLGVLIPMLLLLEEKPLEEVRRLARSVLPSNWLASQSG
jgi:hypothetical protein